MLVLLPMLGIGLVSIKIFYDEAQRMASQNLENVVSGLVTLCRNEWKLESKKLDHRVDLAGRIVHFKGSIHLPLEKVMVPAEAVDPSFPGRPIRLFLQNWHVDNESLVANSGISEELRRLVEPGTKILIKTADDRLFEPVEMKMSEDGSRILSGVLHSADDPITSDILSLKQYRSRENVRGNWYMSACDPLLAPDGSVIGGVLVRKPETEYSELANEVLSIRVGDTGYAFIMDDTGTLIVHPAKTHENIINQKDSSGNRFIADMIQRAKSLGTGRIGTIRYPWINPELGETKARYKLVKFAYFPERKWIVAAGSYESEINAVAIRVSEIMLMWVMISSFMAMMLILGLSRLLTRPLDKLTQAVRAMGQGDRTVRVHTKSRDEIGVLANTFNTMADQIKDYTENLEEIIKDRTSELSASKERYKELSNRLSAILSASTEYAVMAMDLSMNIIEWNTGAERLFGYTREEAVGKMSLADTCLQADISENKIQNLSSRIMRDQPVEFEQFRCSKGGKQFPVLSVMTSMRDANNNVIGFVEVARDVSEQRRLEQELLRTKEYFEAIVESSVDMIITTDPKGLITFCNRAGLNALKYGKEELLGQHVSKLYPRKREQAHFIMKHLLESGFLDGYEMNIIKADNTEIPISISAALLKDDRGNSLGTVGVFKDITKRKELEAELLRTQATLVQAGKMRALGDLVSGVAHELNNPLMASESILFVLKKLIGDNPNLQSKIGVLEQCNFRMEKIIKHLREFSRADEAAFTDIDVREPLENALLITSQQLMDHQVSIERNFGADLPNIWGDKNQLEQVFLNMIANAKDAMENTGRPKKISFTTSLIQSNDKPFVDVSIQDTGKGISPDILDKIFDPFFTTKEVSKGTGLGLAICYGIIGNHGGRIEVVTKPGEGTTFHILLAVSPNAAIKA